ncbi:MAG: hypoxanthine phosphoribosyltransferase [Chloroflexi bacterium]|nr:MAG: hypoxanthine phosphoribosyltransferase [Chloroflexota bacterium]
MATLDDSVLHHELDRVLIDQDTIRERVKQLGRQLAADYGDRHPVFVGVLTGAFIFMADLVRATPIPLDIEFMAVSSYGSATHTSGVVRILKDLEQPIEGRDVVIVEDIIDSGLTLQYLLDVLKRRNPRSVSVVALFNKVKAERGNLPVDYVGFDIPDEFVVGYGLDAGRRFRNLPYVAVYSKR